MAFPGLNMNSMMNFAAPLMGGAAGANGMGGANQGGAQAQMAQAMQMLQLVMQFMMMMQSQMGAMGGGAPNFGGGAGMNPGVGDFLGGSAGGASGGGGGMPTSYGSDSGSAPTGGASGADSVGPIGPTMPGDPAGAVAIAQSLKGRESRTLTKNDLPAFTRTGEATNNCAEFVSSCLDKAGAYKKQPGDASVATLAQNLQKQGWRKVSKEQTKPGDVAVYNGSQHVELVAQPGGKQLIGSNGSALQVVGTSTGSWGNIEYYSKG